MFFYCIIIFEIFIFYLNIYFVHVFKENKFQSAISNIDFLYNRDPCKVSMIKCKNQSDCDRCLKKYSCESGYCVKKISDGITCDGDRGMYPILIKSDGKDEYKCTSIFPLYFDANGNTYDYVCKNGFININRFTPIDDRICVCDKLNYRKIFVHGIPTCVRNDKFYLKN